MRLIDADAVKFNFKYGYDDNGILLVPYRDAKKLIEAAKTVDAVPVTRCKDCASTRKKDDYESVYLCDEVLICTNCEGGWQPVWPTHFCSYGCPREEHDAEPKE